MAELSGFERRTLKKKATIRESASRLFFEKGAEATTIAEIARRAGVSQVSIYNYFSSKEGLLEEVIRGHLDASLDAAERILELDLSFRDKMERFLNMGEQLKNETEDELLDAVNWSSPAIQRIYGRFVAERQVPFLIRFIELGKLEGAIDAKLSTDAVLAYFNANMAIYKDENLLKKGKEYLSSLSHLFFYGLLGR